jgi:hypothetical protein
MCVECLFWHSGDHVTLAGVGESLALARMAKTD